MSRRGDCYDNAVIESFFATVKAELAERFASYGDAKMALLRSSVARWHDKGALGGLQSPPGCWI